MDETGEALRCCMEQLLLVRDEKERLVTEAANRISSEQKTTQDLQQKFEDANKQFQKVIAENHNLRNTVDSKEKLIKELKESKAHSDQKLTDATARLEFSQKQCASLKYEVRMLREELEIRNKEREYDLRSIHAARKQQQESAKKIAALEAECQRLRTMVQKRLPGPAALAKMKDEVMRQGAASSAENGTRRPRAAMQPQLRARHSVSEGYQVKLQELGEENRHLRQLLAQKESDLQFIQSKYVDEACKLSLLQKQHEELSGGIHGLSENNHPERMVSALAKLDHSRSGKLQVSQIRRRGRRITGSDIQLLVDPMEIEKLERTSRPSSAPHQCEDTPDADSKMVVSETVHRDLIPGDAFSDKYPEWVQDVLKVILHKHQVSKISVASIIDEVTHALRSEISAKGNDVAHLLSCNRAEIDKMVATLIERVSSMVERSAKDNVTRFRSCLHEKSELTLRLEHLVHVCRAVLDGTFNLEKLTDEVCLILERTVSKCFSSPDGLDVVEYTTNNSDGNESLRTLSIHEKDALQSTNSEMAFGTQQEKQQELIETTKGQIPDVTLENHSHIEFTSNLDEELLAVNQVQGDSYQEQHPVHRETQSVASDGSKTEEGEIQKRTSAISAAAKKLAECQESIANLSKQLHALESPASADASDKEKRTTLPLPAASLPAEADPKPEDLSPPTSEEAARIKDHSEPDATEKGPEHEDPGTGAKARKGGSSTPIVARPMVPRSPRASGSGDARKKKRRASLLSRLVFRKKA